MNSNKIESLSIANLQIMIDSHPLMQSYINSNDKEPSWDGNIYTYTNKNLKAEHIKYKIPVQVKGKNDENLLDKNEITYPVKYKHLQNYYNDGGVFYLVIVISNDGKRISIFYNGLTSIKLDSFLNEKPNIKEESTKNIPLKLVTDSNELFLKLMQFGYDKEQQGSGNGEIIKHSIDLSKIENLSSIKIKSFGPKNIFDLMEKISTGEVCLYGKTSELDIWRPFKYKQQLDSYIRPCITENKIVKCNDINYYTKYKIEFISEAQSYIYLSKNLKLKININNDLKLEFNTNDTIKSISHDLNFIEDLLKTKKLYLDDKLFFELKNIDFPKDDFKDFKTAENALSYFNIEYNKKVIDFKDADWEFINILNDIYLGKIPNFEGDFQIFKLEIDKIIIPFLFLKDEKNKINAYNLTFPKEIATTISFDNEIKYRVPSFMIYKRKDWDYLYDFEEKLFLEEIEKSDFNTYTQDNFSILFVEILSSYDNTKKEKYYNIANLISDKLLEVDANNEYWKINKFQLLKRKNLLTEEHLEEISKIEENTTNKFSLCACNILLENKFKARKEINNLPDEDKTIFKDFPIYNLL